MDLMFPKIPTKKKRKKHAKSIIQPKEDKRCYLCMLLHHDYSRKYVEEHHIFPGSGRAKSEALGLKCNLCTEHHRTGLEAVHRNMEISRKLMQIAQKTYEQTHSHEEWMAEMGRNYIDTSKKG